MEQKDIELLKRIRNYLPNHSPMAVHAVYISPAQQMRNAADRIEQQENDERLYNELITRLESSLP